MTGRGSILLQSKSEIEEGTRSTKIIFTELPYQVNKSKLIEDMAEMVKGGRLEGISDLRDESDKDGIRTGRGGQERLQCSCGLKSTA